MVPSEIYESFSYTVAQGMSCEKIVIGSNIGGIPETLKFGELGKMFNPGNIKELADSIEEVLINKDKYKIIEKAARKYVVKNFSSGALKERYLKFYQSLIKSTKLVIISPFQFTYRRGVERFTYSLANQLARDFGISIYIYTWSSQNKIHWGNWHKNIKIRQTPSSKYFQKFWAIIFYRIWLLIDKPTKVIVNFLYHGEEYLIKNLEYFYVLHSPANLISSRYEYIKKNISNFLSLKFIAVSKYVKNEAINYIKDYPIKVIYNGVDTKKFSKKKKSQIRLHEL